MFSVRKTNPSKVLYIRGWSSFNTTHEPIGYWAVVDKDDHVYKSHGSYAIYDRKYTAQHEANFLNNSIKVKEFKNETV